MMTMTADLVSEALAAAVRAPSAYNTQPWRFAVGDDRIDVLLDRARVLQVADREAREARLACGAAVLNLRLALRAAGVGVTVDLVPDQGDSDLLARVHIDGDEPATPTESQLARQIPLRRTNRLPFLERSVEPPKLYELTAAAREEGARLEPVDGARYTRVADLIRRADHHQQQDPAYEQEFRRWTGGPPGRPDGVPLSTVGPAPDPERSLTLRTYYRPSPIPWRPYEQQPLLTAVLTPGHGPRADVAAGMAMQRVLLTACRLGLAGSFLSQPFEVPEMRAALVDEFAELGQVHTLLRIGYGYPVARAPRRPVDDVTTSR